jgi:hypothetical protein
MPASNDRHFLNSTYREKVIEHVFVGELLRLLWVAGIHDIEILKPEVDSSGYDIVIAYKTLIRHIQIKASVFNGKIPGQKINASLARHPSGCVVWVLVDDSLSFWGFRWFGDAPGLPLPSLFDFKQAKQTRPNLQGIKVERANTKSIPRSAFESIPDLPALVRKLLGEDVL